MMVTMMLLMMTTMTMMLLPMIMVTMIIVNDPNLCTSPTGEKAVLGLGWFGEFQ